MEKIEVLHVIARMNRGGTSRYLYELVSRMPNNAIATGFVQGSELEETFLNNLPVIRIPNLGRRIALIKDFKAWLELFAVIREISPRIVHTHTFKAGLIGRLIPGNHKRIHTFHGHLLKDESFNPISKKIILIIERILSNKTDICVSVGETVGDELRKAGISGKAWVSIPPGIQALPQIGQSKARASFNLRNSKLIVGWMARMTAVKNPELVFDVARKLPEIQFVMAGEGDMFNLVARTAPQNIKVIGWANAANFWSAVDIALSTSHNEGMPIALIEAQLAGLPVVCTDVGSNSEVIQNGRTGFVTAINVDELAMAIEKLETEITLRETMGRCGAERAKSKFSIQNFISAHQSIYGSVLD